MRRITKFGSIALALLVTVPALMTLDLFGGAAAQGPPVLYNQQELDPVTHVAHPDLPLGGGVHAFAYVLSEAGGDLVVIGDRSDPGGLPLFDTIVPGQVTSLEMDIDGSELLFGTSDGAVHLVTTTSTLYDTHERFQTGGTVTAVDIDPHGMWFTATTFHGDVYFFNRQRFVGSNAFEWHHQAPLPAGGSPVNPDAYPPELRDLPAELFAGASLRPYSHVALAGSSPSSSPAGLLVVAATRFGEVWVFDPAQAIGANGASVLRPTSHRVFPGECQSLGVADLEAPCDQEAAARLVERIDAISGSVGHAALQPIADALRDLFTLDPVLGVLPLRAEAPLEAMAVMPGFTQSRSSSVIVGSDAGRLHALAVSGAGSGTAPQITERWTQAGFSAITALAISAPHSNGNGARATLAVGDDGGKVAIYAVDPVSMQAPTPQHQETIGQGSIEQIAVSVGDALFTQSSAGRYVTFTTGAMFAHLWQTRGHFSGTVTELWTGERPILATSNDLAVSQTGSVLLGSDGITLFGGMPTVRIEAPNSATKNSAFTATAQVAAPDSNIVTREWTITDADDVELHSTTAESLTYTFITEGRFTLKLTATDDNNFQAIDTHTVNVGGKGPVIKLIAPAQGATGQPIVFDLNGTRDGDAPEGQLGLDRIELFPYGDDEMVLVPLATLQSEVVYDAIGEYRANIVAYDDDGRSTSTEHRITISDGGWCIADGQAIGEDACEDPGTPTDPNPPGNGTGNGTGNETGNGTGNQTDPNTPPDATFSSQTEGFLIKVDATGSSDPDGDPLTYEWYFGDGGQAHGIQAQHAYSVAGSYTISLIVRDGNGGSDMHQRTVTIDLCGPNSTPGSVSNIGYNRLTVASASGHTVSFGAPGSDSSRFDLRSPSTHLLYREPGGGSEVTAAALRADGCALYVGHQDGTASYIDTNDPSERITVDLFEDRPVSFIQVSANGAYVLFATPDGDVRITRGLFAAFPDNFTTTAPIVQVTSDRHMHNVIVGTDDGALHLVDGRSNKKGIQDSYTPGGEVTTIAMSPGVDTMGRSWLFIGREDGRLEIVKIQGHRFYPAGSIPVQADVPIAALATGAYDGGRHYTVGILTRSESPICQAGTEDPCGRLALIDSGGPTESGLPVVKTKYEFTSRHSGLVMNPEGRHFLLEGPGSNSVQRFDQIWDQGPIQSLSGFGSRIGQLQMADNGNAYALLSNGKLVWFFAPPLADMRIGPEDHNGLPMWGARVTALRDTHFDSSPSRPGVGNIIATHWEFDDGSDSYDPLAIHQFDEQDVYRVILTVTTRVDAGRETILTDRLRVPVQVWNPPPVAAISAQPFDGSLGAVNITSGESVLFDAGASFDPHGGRIVQYAFRFGDGVGASGPQDARTHIYGAPGVFYANVKVTDDNGFSTASSSIKVIVANRAPTASFQYAQPERNETNGWVTAGVPVRFDGTGSTDPDGHVAAYEWTFPGGITKTGATVTHTFPSAGSAAVSLRVQDGHGVWSSSTSQTLTVDDGIRLIHTQDPENGRTINPARKVHAHGLVHDFDNHPAQGNPLAGVEVVAEVYYDGPLGSQPSTTPYQTMIHVTNATGEIQHEVAYNQGVAFKPGKYRIQLTARDIGSANGDTEYSRTTETHFVVS